MYPRSVKQTLINKSSQSHVSNHQSSNLETASFGGGVNIPMPHPATAQTPAGGTRRTVSERVWVHRGGTLRTEDGDEDDENSGGDTHICGRGEVRASRVIECCKGGCKTRSIGRT